RCLDLDRHLGAASARRVQPGSLSQPARQHHVERHPMGLALGLLPNLPQNGRIARLPNASAGLDLVDALLGAEPDQGLDAARRLFDLAPLHDDVVDAAANLALAREATLDEEAIAARDLRREAYDDVAFPAEDADALRLADERADVIAR